MVIQSIQAFYEVCAIKLRQLPEGLSVISLDSGSDKLIDFLGVDKIIDCVRETLSELYHITLFHKERKATVSIDVLRQSLTAIKEMQELVEQDIITQEDCARVSHKLLTSAEGFIRTGAITPEMQEHAYHNPRLIMAPEPKLLSAPTQTISTTAQQDAIVEGVVEVDDEVNGESADLDIDNLSPDVKAQLIRLLQSGGSKSKSKPEAEPDFTDDDPLDE